MVSKLYQGVELGTLVSKDKRGRDKVRQVLNYLVRRLESELDKKHVWLATCTVAVTAGWWRADRFRTRRQKLLVLINKCRVFLDLPAVELEGKYWYDHNIYDGYSAHQKWAARTGMSVRTSILYSGYVLTPGGVTNGGYFSDVLDDAPATGDLLKGKEETNV